MVVFLRFLSFKYHPFILTVHRRSLDLTVGDWKKGEVPDQSVPDITSCTFVPSPSFLSEDNNPDLFDLSNFCHALDPTCCSSLNPLEFLVSLRWLDHSNLLEVVSQVCVKIFYLFIVLLLLACFTCTLKGWNCLAFC